MEKLSCFDPNMAVLASRTQPLSSFALLSSSFSDRLLERMGFSFEGYSPVDLAFLEEEAEETPLADSQTPIIQLDLKLILKALRAGEKETEKALEQKILERVLRLQTVRQTDLRQQLQLRQENQYHLHQSLLRQGDRYLLQQSFPLNMRNITTLFSPRAVSAPQGSRQGQVQSTGYSGPAAVSWKSKKTASTAPISSRIPANAETAAGSASAFGSKLPSAAGSASKTGNTALLTAGIAARSGDAASSLTRPAPAFGHRAPSMAGTAADLGTKTASMGEVAIGSNQLLAALGPAADLNTTAPALVPLMTGDQFADSPTESRSMNRDSRSFHTISSFTEKLLSSLGADKLLQGSAVTEIKGRLTPETQDQTASGRASVRSALQAAQPGPDPADRAAAAAIQRQTETTATHALQKQTEDALASTMPKLPDTASASAVQQAGENLSAAGTSASSLQAQGIPGAVLPELQPRTAESAAVSIAAPSEPDWKEQAPLELALSDARAQDVGEAANAAAYQTGGIETALSRALNSALQKQVQRAARQRAQERRTEEYAPSPASEGTKAAADAARHQRTSSSAPGGTKAAADADRRQTRSSLMPGAAASKAEPGKPEPDKQGTLSAASSEAPVKQPRAAQTVKAPSLGAVTAPAPAHGAAPLSDRRDERTDFTGAGLKGISKNTSGEAAASVRTREPVPVYTEPNQNLSSAEFDRDLQETSSCRGTAVPAFESLEGWSYPMGLTYHQVEEVPAVGRDKQAAQELGATLEAAVQRAWQSRQNRQLGQAQAPRESGKQNRPETNQKAAASGSSLAPTVGTVPPADRETGKGPTTAKAPLTGSPAQTEGETARFGVPYASLLQPMGIHAPGQGQPLQENKQGVGSTVELKRPAALMTLSGNPLRGVSAVPGAGTAALARNIAWQGTELTHYQAETAIQPGSQAEALAAAGAGNALGRSAAVGRSAFSDMEHGSMSSLHDRDENARQTAGEGLLAEQKRRQWGQQPSLSLLSSMAKPETERAGVARLPSAAEEPSRAAVSDPVRPAALPLTYAAKIETGQAAPAPSPNTMGKAEPEVPGTSVRREIQLGSSVQGFAQKRTAAAMGILNQFAAAAGPAAAAGLSGSSAGTTAGLSGSSADTAAGLVWTSAGTAAGSVNAAGPAGAVDAADGTAFAPVGTGDLAGKPAGTNSTKALPTWAREFLASTYEPIETVHPMNAVSAEAQHQNGGGGTAAGTQWGSGTSPAAGTSTQLLSGSRAANRFAGAAGGVKAQKQMVWASPSTVAAQTQTRPVDLAFQEKKNKVSEQRTEARMSEAELKRAADRIYQMIESRLKQERRRMGY